MPSAIKSPRTEQAYEKLKWEILQNHLPPGFQASEPEFALRLGMSRTPIREALLRLEADGLIEMKPRHGARVTPLSWNDMRDIYDILTCLEPEAAAAVARLKPDPITLKPLSDATDDMEKALANNDLDNWAAADDRFHRDLLRLQDNRRLTDFVTRLLDQSHRVRMITLRMRNRPTQSTEDHRTILRHIENGEAGKARETSRRHRERAASELLSLLQNYRLTAL